MSNREALDHPTDVDGKNGTRDGIVTASPTNVPMAPPAATSALTSALTDGLPEDRYLNRELSWLDFNSRVLALAEDTSLP
ncbi:RNA degradosome polyphosphate kinase, partial [Rhodococcus koreensis]